MAGDNQVVIAFDLYGTLLSTESIASDLATVFGHDAAKLLAASWRRYQLEYSWRLSCMGQSSFLLFPSQTKESPFWPAGRQHSTLTWGGTGLYHSFSDLTRAALQHAVAEAGLTLTPQHEDKLMEAYNGLHVFPDVPGALKTVQETPNVLALIFSNGTEEMVSASIRTSQHLNSHAALFRQLVTVDDVKTFKPCGQTYSHLLQAVGKQSAPGDVWLVTANPFDVVGAASMGLRAAWIDRAGRGWVDRLGSVIGAQPSLIASGVDQAVAQILGGAASESG